MRFTYYLLCKLRQKKRKVLFIFRDVAYLFEDTFVCHLESIDYQSIKDVIVVYDQKICIKELVFLLLIAGKL